MFSNYFIFILTLPAIYAQWTFIDSSQTRLKIHITLSNKRDELQIKLSGFHRAAIIPNEIGLSDGLANDVLENDLGELAERKTFNWSQVIRTIEPNIANFLSVDFQNSVLLTKEIFLNNNSMSRENVIANFSQDVENILKINWPKVPKLSLNKEDVGLVFDPYLLPRTITMEFVSKWGVNVNSWIPDKINLNSSLTIPLKPNQAVIAKLIISRAEIEMEVIYEVTLNGSIYVKFLNSERSDTQINVQRLIEYAKLDTFATEAIKFVYHYEPRIVVSEL